MVSISCKNLPPQSCLRLTVKGCGEQGVFLFSSDYEHYRRLLNKHKLKFGVKIYGFCLMPEYVQLVLQADTPVDMFRFIEEVGAQYAIYFNNKYQRAGRLWQKDFRALLIRNFAQLAGCLNDIEREPVRARLCGSPLEYPWSSYIYRILNVKNEKKLRTRTGAILDPTTLVRGVFLRRYSLMSLERAVGLFTGCSHSC